MEKKTNSQELQSRREFFKRAAKGALPVLAAVVISNVPVLAQATESGSCNGCSNGCKDGCHRSCQSQCSRHCEGASQKVGPRECGTCQSLCYGCKGTCHGDCKASCSGLGYTAC